jgi:hypothetical protein
MFQVGIYRWQSVIRAASRGVKQSRGPTGRTHSSISSQIPAWCDEAADNFQSQLTTIHNLILHMAVRDE